MEPEKKSNGALVGVVIIIIVLLVGAVYVWQTQISESPTLTPETAQEERDLNSLEQELQNTSIEIEASAIESLQ